MTTDHRAALKDEQRGKQPRATNSQQIALRSGGIGEPLRSGGVRRTARTGVRPLALPHEMARLFVRQSHAVDAAEREYLDVAVDVPLTYLSIEDAILARRHWPEYRVVMIGVDLRHTGWGERIPQGIYLPIYPNKGDEVQTYGTRFLRLCTRIYWKSSPIYGELLWQLGWDGEHPSIRGEGIGLRHNREAVFMAQQGLELLQGIVPRGRTPGERDRELDRLARIGLKWVQQPGKGHTPDQLDWSIIAMTDRNRGVGKVKTAASKKGIGIEDVRQRARELQAQSRS